MNIVKSTEQFDINFVFFYDPIKNNIMNDGYFIRILYSTDCLILNGIYIIVNIHNFTCEKYYDKYRCIFNVHTHKDMIQKIKRIEESILNKIDIKNKTPQIKINEQLENGNIKIFNDILNNNSNAFVLKISGVWETSQNYGLTYKFIKINN